MIHKEDDKWVEKYNNPSKLDLKEVGKKFDELLEAKTKEKKLLIEMMQEDEKSGMYDITEDTTNCGVCGKLLTLVRPGKHQCDYCEANARIAELEEQNADLKILLDSARAELERKEKTLEEYRRYVRW